MSDSDRRLWAAEDEERDGRGGQRERAKRRHVTHEHTSPVWRVVALALAAGSVVALGYWLEIVGYAHYFATVVVVASAEAVRVWARKRPDRLRRRVWAFAPLADAIRQTGENLERATYKLPLRVGFGIGVVKGIAVVIGQGIVVTVLGALYSWHLAVALAAGVAAVAAAPQMFLALRDKIALDDDPEPEDGDLSAGQDEAGEELDEHGRGEGP